MPRRSAVALGAERALADEAPLRERDEPIEAHLEGRVELRVDQRLLALKKSTSMRSSPASMRATSSASSPAGLMSNAARRA